MNRLPYLLLLLYVSLLIYIGLNYESIWFDDAYTLALIQHHWSDIIVFTSFDFHPPLYYFITKFFSLFLGTETTIIRLTSVIPIFLTLVLGYQFLQKEFSKSAALFFLLFVISSETVLQYAIEIRMYSWNIFLVLSCTIAMYYTWFRKSLFWCIVLMFTLLCTAYTHYYTSLIVGIGFLFLVTISFLKERKLFYKLLIIAITALVLYLPWVIKVMNYLLKGSSSYWISQFTFLDFLQCIGVLFKTYNAYVSASLLLLFSFISVKFLFKKDKSTKENFAFFILLTVLTFVGVAVAISVLYYPLFIPRHFVPCIALILLFGAIAFADAQFFKKPLEYFLLILVVLNLSKNLLDSNIDNQGFQTFKNHFGQIIHKNDILIAEPAEKLGHEIGIMAYLFPSQTMAITKNIPDRKENNTLDYHLSPFKLKILKYSEIPRKGKMWIIRPYEGKEEISFNNQKFIKKGEYGWRTFHTGYRLEIYGEE